jgi:hypothetical protein
MKTSTDALENNAVDLPTRIERWRRALTVAELADLVHLSAKQVYERTHKSQIPCYCIAGSIRFDPFLVADWLPKQVA